MTSKMHNIFLVEDDEDDRMFFEDALNDVSNNYKLTLFENGDEFLEFFATNQKELPDVVFMDLNMPIKNGIECLEGLNAIDKIASLKIFVYSTSVHSAMTNKAYNLGAYGYLCKPNSFELIKTMINKSLQKIETGKERPDFANFVTRL